MSIWNGRTRAAEIPFLKTDSAQSGARPRSLAEACTAPGSSNPSNRWRTSLRNRALLATFTWILGTTFAVAQIGGRSTISGTVTDPSGAVIPGAQVTVIDVDRNVQQVTTANSAGYYELPNLQPSTYRITFSAAGFDKLERTKITLPASSRISVPASLKLGSDTSVITVTADASLLNTESSAMGTVLTTQQIKNMPSSGANPMQLVSLQPGIQAPNSQIYSASDTLSWNGVSKFGAAGYLNANEWNVDGMPNMSNPRGNAIQLSTDTVDQMRVDAISFDPQMGHTMGAMITQTTKSGTEAFHGTAHLFYQSSGWMAQPRFAALNYQYQKAKAGCVPGGAATDGQCTGLKYQYGIPSLNTWITSYTLGGPVRIPHVWKGSDKLFFFTAFENNNWSDATASSANVPTVRMRSGDFSELPATTSGIPSTYTAACGSAAYYGQYQIYNPFSVKLDGNGIPRRQPFCGNQVPTSLMTTTAGLTKTYNSFLPTPTNSNVTGSNYSYTALGTYLFRQVTARGDYAITENNHAFVRWTRATYWKQQSGFTVSNADAQISPKTIQLGSAGIDHIFNANTDLALTVGYSLWTTGCCYYPSYQKYTPSSIGLPTYLDAYGGVGQSLPNIAVGPYSQVGQTNNVPAIYRNYSVTSILNHVAGHHSMRFGGEWRQQMYSQGAQGNVNGTYSFDSSYTRQNNGSDNAYPSSTYGLAYAAFLMGIPTTSSVGTTYPKSVRTPYFAFFAGDNWHITSKLTLLPGIRFEYELGPAELRNAQIVGFDPNATIDIAGAANSAYQSALAGATAAQKAQLPASLDIRGGPMYAGLNGNPTRQFVNNWRVLPRVGAAFQLTPKTVLHGGYGIFYDTLNAHNNGGSPHGGISGADGTWGGVQYSTNQDGYSASTSIASSTNYGQNFVAGTTPLSDPFPVTNGARFNQAIGNAAGLDYYLGSSPTLYDHDFRPTRSQRGYLGLQRQFGNSTMVEVAWVGAWTDRIAISQNMAPIPASFYSGGNQPNTTSATLLSSQITNPYAIGNFSSLQTSNPAAYGLIALRGYYTAAKTNISNLIIPYSQLGGLTLYRAIGKSNFQEIQVNATKRYASGLTFIGSLQLNWQNDKDYFANSYDKEPSWRLSNNSLPYRVTGQVVYEMPFGHGKQFLTHGLLSQVLGNFQVAGTYERQPGPLVSFGNLFYIGDPTSAIKLKNPVYNNAGLQGGTNTIQWLNLGNVTTTYANGVCSYSGTGFVTNASCQPGSYNSRVFPSRIAGVRNQATDTIQLGVAKRFYTMDRVQLETRAEMYNLLNRQVLGTPNVSPTSTTFGMITGDGGANGAGNGRWLSLQAKISF